jgi:hypothetical protein
MRRLMIPLNFLLMVVMGTLIALKITGNTTLSWWVVLTPLWVTIAYDLSVVLLAQSKDSAGHIGSFFTRRRRMREVMDLGTEPTKPSGASDSANWWSK